MNQTLIDLIVTLGSRVLVKRKSLTKQIYRVTIFNWPSPV